MKAGSSPRVLVSRAAAARVRPSGPSGFTVTPASPGASGRLSRGEPPRDRSATPSRPPPALPPVAAEAPHNGVEVRVASLSGLSSGRLSGAAAPPPDV